MRRTLAAIVSCLAIAGSAPVATAAADAATAPAAAPSSWSVVEGRVARIDGHVVTVMTGDGRRVAVDLTAMIAETDPTNVMRPGRQVRFFGLMSGDGRLLARGLVLDYDNPPAASPRSTGP